MTVRLVGSLIVRNELDRYLEPCVEHLLAFCDELRILDDGSTDGTLDYLRSVDRVVAVSQEPGFFEHEGRARQALLEHTLAGEPTHILAIDADEFVADGQAVRASCAGRQHAFSLVMEEIWQADELELRVREDGGWRAHPVPILYRVPDPRWRRESEWRIADRALACGREPRAIRRIGSRGQATGTEVLHFGWTRETSRQARHERYAVADGGRFHAGSHLASILWPDTKVRLRARAWPVALEPYREQLIP